MIALVIAAAATSFQAAFPEAATTKGASGEHLKAASGFAAKDLGDAPGAAARAFLDKYGEAFGASAPFVLVQRGAPEKGQSGPVRFERRIGSWPLFDGDVVVGVDGQGAVILVNAADVPKAVVHKGRISRAAAVEAARSAIPGLVTDDQPRAQRGYKAVGSAVRPVWRVEFTASKPAGDFRTDVDARTGKVLHRVDLRVSQNGGIAGPKNLGSLDKK